MNINFLSVEVGVHLCEVVDKILVQVITELLDFIYVFENALLFPLVGIVSLLKRFQLVVDRLQFLAEILTIHLELFLVVFGNVLSVQLGHRILVLLGNKFSSKLSSIGLDKIFN
jgi:putative Ca2+/H+ antiporter (TMEM165/GDT1 family)